jgi:hypothetical protein
MRGAGRVFGDDVYVLVHESLKIGVQQCNCVRTFGFHLNVTRGSIAL